MVQIVHAVLRNALQSAMREEIVVRNVAQLVQVESPDYEVGTGLTAADAKKLLAVVRDDRLHALYVLALVGMRKGELLGLAWDAVDLDGGTLEIRQTLQRIRGELRLDAPKTRRSRRVIPLPPFCVRALREHHARQAAARRGWVRSGIRPGSSSPRPSGRRSIPAT
jgi:integrase